MTIGYPEALPVESITKLASLLVSSGEVDRKEAIKTAWVVTGYVLKLTVGEPGDGNISALLLNNIVAASTELDDATLAVLLHSLVAAPEVPKAAGVLDGLLGSEFIRTQLAKLLLPALLNLLKRWLEAQTGAGSMRWSIKS